MASRGVTIVPPPIPRRPDATPATAPVVPSMKAVGHDISAQLDLADWLRVDSMPSGGAVAAAAAAVFDDASWGVAEVAGFGGPGVMADTGCLL